MKGLDTNVLVRFLVRDDEIQAEIVYQRFKQAELNGEELFISVPVVLETIWVLESVYKVERAHLLDSIEALMQMPILKFEAQPAVHSMVTSARQSNTDLSDLLIGQSAKYAGCDAVLTFDQRAAVLDLFKLLQ